LKTIEIQAKWLYMKENREDTRKYSKTGQLAGAFGEVVETPSPKRRLKTIGMQDKWLQNLGAKEVAGKFKKLRGLD
jgi:hypothetical protein